MIFFKIKDNKPLITVIIIIIILSHKCIPNILFEID